MPEPTSPRDNRWWENYAVRYLLPTLTGMLFLRWLQLTTKGFFSPILPPAGDLAGPTPFKDLGMPELLVWAGAGFAFAYVASLPILVFHATRSLEANGLRKPRRLSPSTITTGLLCATIALALARHFCDGWPGLPFIALLIAGAFCLAQRRRIKAASLGRIPAVEYARALARKRASASEASERWVDEYVTSYRHLREHGNAAFILLLQAILCTLVYICLTAVPGYERWTWDTMHEGQWMAFAICFLLLVLWIAPAVSVHQLSQKLEAHLTAGRGPGSPETAMAPAPRPSAPRQPSQHPASPVAQPSAASPAPARATTPRLLARMLKTVSQCSPWLLPLAFCPPILLLWFHLQNLHYPALLMSAISSTAGLGALLLLGGLVWLLWLLSLAFPSLLVAASASLYQPGGVPVRLVYAWIGVCLCAAGGSFAAIQLTATLPGWAFHLIYATLALPVGLAAWSRPPTPLIPPRNDSVRRVQAVLSGGWFFLIALLALYLLLLPLYLVSRAYAKEPDSLYLVTGVVGFSFLGALLPGIAFAWRCRRDAHGGRKPMSASGFAVLLLIPPLLSTLYLSAIHKQLSYLTLTAAGIVDKGGSDARPKLLRLPDNWREHDRQLTAGFPPLTQCAATEAAAPEKSAWLCGYTNFAFGNTQLICDKSYADDRGGYVSEALTCLVFAGNQVVNLVKLPKPGLRR